MKITYVKDSDTLMIRFNNHEVAATSKVTDDVVLEQDARGCLVNLTIRHAHNHTEIAGFSFNQVDGMRAL